MTPFIEQSLVFIGAAVVLVPLFKRLGFGSVLGYLIAGIFVGPQGLKLIQDSESVMHFSELGVALLLFLIGLEIQPRKLWSMRVHLLGLGGLQVITTSIIFAFLAWLLGLPPVAAIVIGFALSLSSTAFAIQTLVERNQFNTEFGRGSFSILLMQDLIAIPALAIIPALGVAQESTSSFNTALFAIFVVAFLILARQFLIRPLFRIIASTNTREIFTAATLFIVLGVAALMMKAGMSAALGTFIAGVLLADSEYRHELEANLEPFKSLLMGLFFIAVGMSVNLQLIIDQPVLVFGFALAYLAIKGLIIYGIGRVFKFNHNNSKLMALSIAQGGEFAFVIFGIILTLQIAPSETLSFLTVVITLSMALNPLFGLLNEKFSDRWQRKAPEPDFDKIEDETPQVIIAGFGRFGQIFGRLLRAQNIPFVAIDHDSEQVELIRKFGAKVYYGDASRLELLEAAGAAKAKYFILAIDDADVSLATARTVVGHFKNLKIFARARNRGHAFDLMALGITAVKREIFDSSIYFARDLLVDMGYAPGRADILIEKFKLHDEIMLEEQFKVRHDDKMYISVAKQGAAQLAQVLSDDNKQGYISRK
jgi:monovalent cation:proton antiporter-2 (CPA2) family protein